MSSDDLITVANGGYSNGSGTMTITLPSSQTGYSSTLLAIGAGGGGGSIPNSISYPTASGTYTSASTGWSNPKITAEAEITISRPGKPPIRVAETLSVIMEALCIILPDENLMSKYPALREAYDEHQKKWLDSMSNNGVREAYDSYHTIKSLVAAGDEDE